jgi:hypothetical protein
MLTDHLELTDGTLKSVDALVTKSDGPHFLWATVHFILNGKPAQHLEGELSDQTPARLRRPGKSREEWNGGRPTLLKLASDEKALPIFAKSLAKHSEWNCPNSDQTRSTALSRFERLAAL